MTEQETMYEKYGTTQKDYEEIVCGECYGLLGYSYGNIDAMLDDIHVLCKDCKELLP